MTRRIFLLAMVFFSCLSFGPARVRAQEPAPTCGGEPQQDCPCGKMPVCIVSDHEDGFFSQSLLDQAEHASWEGFGQDGMSDFAAAMYAETLMAAALANAPCIEPVWMNSYHTGTLIVADEAEQTGLTQQIQDAIAAGDTERLKELQAQLDKIFEKYGLGDLPWRDPELAGEQLQQRLLSCATGMVELKGQSGPDGFTLSAETSSALGQVSGRTSSATSSSPSGGIADLAKQVAKELTQIRQKLFCACEMVLERCNVTNFDLANQESECVRVKSCCGQTVNEEPEKEKVKGIAFGESRKYESKCCSPLARVRAGEQVGDSGEEDRQTMNEIWCPGTWNLRGRDFDCDGVPNAQDPTPRPVKEN